MTLRELYDSTVSNLSAALGAGEAKATARLLLEDDLKVDSTQLLLRGDRIVEPETESRFRGYVERICGGEPPQYVVGSARWMGMDFKVTPATLIPRPETAELVDIITDQWGSRQDVRVLDVGTGSGCLAIALDRALPFASVQAVDISAEALDVARFNARKLHTDVNFRQMDILKDFPVGPFDIIVSNPPYICESERGDMEPRVKDYEPPTALFVPDSDPLRFYKAISRQAATVLSPGGEIYFEINPLKAEALADDMKAMGYEVQLLRDSYGKMRFAILKTQ